MEIPNGIYVFVVGVIHAACHPDSSMFTLRFTGFDNLTIMIIAILSSTIVNIVLYFLNRFGINLLTKRKSFRFIEKIKLFSSTLVCELGYIGMIILSLIPQVPYMRETAMLAGQTLQLEYTLPVVLGTNIIRIAGVYIFFFNVIL